MPVETTLGSNIRTVWAFMWIPQCCLYLRPMWYTSPFRSAQDKKKKSRLTSGLIAMSHPYYMLHIVHYTYDQRVAKSAASACHAVLVSLGTHCIYEMITAPVYILLLVLFWGTC